MSGSLRHWSLRAFLLLPAYWVLRDAVRLNAREYVSLVVVPWAGLVLASWLLAARIFDPRRRGLRLALGLVALVCAWGVLRTGSMPTRLVLLPALVCASASVVPPLALAAAAVLLVLAALELALRLRPALLPIEARQALPLDTRARLACFFRTPNGCLAAEALQNFPPDLAFVYKPDLNVVLWHPESGFWTLRTDDRGFPNVDASVQERADVVVLGDSFMQGVLVEPEESFPARLAAGTGRRVEQLGRSVDELRALAAGAGARLVILYVPTMEEVYLPLVAPGSPIWGPTPKDGVLEKLARLRAVATSLARPEELLDLTEPLGAVARRGESLYWTHDPHWNRRGNAAVATIVARHLGVDPGAAR